MLMPDATKFDLKEFPKDVVEVFMHGGAGPALVTMRKRYARARPGWCERAIDWLEKNVDHGPDYATADKARITFKIGDHGAVSGLGVSAALPGAQIVKIMEIINQGRVLKVVDARDKDRVYYVMADQILPALAPT
jgi:hypothetical protein